MGKFLRFIGILFMGLTSALVLLSGVGTGCVAFAPDKFAVDSLAGIAQYQWLYIIYVIAFILFGIMGIRATISLVRGKKNSYRDALIVLVLSIVVGGIHMATSRALREGGSSMPLDIIVYAAIFTLLLFLLFSFPKIKKMVGFDEGGSNGKTAAGGMTAIVMGMLVSSVQMWAGPTHIFDGVNLADAFHTQMMVAGGLLFVIGLGMFIYAALNSAPATATQENSLSA